MGPGSLPDTLLNGRTLAVTLARIRGGSPGEEDGAWSASSTRRQHGGRYSHVLAAERARTRGPARRGGARVQRCSVVGNGPGGEGDGNWDGAPAVRPAPPPARSFPPVGRGAGEGGSPQRVRGAARPASWRRRRALHGRAPHSRVAFRGGRVESRDPHVQPEGRDHPRSRLGVTRAGRPF